MVVPLNIKHNMIGDSKHDKNQKITDFTTKISTSSSSKESEQSPISCKRTISTLSLASPAPSVKCHIMENTTNNPTLNTETDPVQSEKAGDSNSSTEENASMQKALGPLIAEFGLLRESVNTVHADLKQTISKQKEEVHYELSNKIESNTKQLFAITEEKKYLK